MTRRPKSPGGPGFAPAGLPGTGTPGSAQPGSARPGAGQLTVPPATAGQPGAGQLASGQLASGQSGVGQSGVGQSGAGPAGAARTAGPPGSGAPRPGKSRRRAGDPWRAAFLCVLAAAVVIGAAWALLGSSLLVVRHIKVTGNHQVTPAQLRAVAGIRMGTPLARLNEKRAIARLDRIAWVRSATVSRSWPDTVVISVRERTPELTVAVGGQFELVDIDGVVVRTQPTRPPGVPLLAPAPARLRGSPAVRAATAVLGSLPGSIRDRVLSVTTGASGVTESVTLRLRGGIRVRWGNTGRSAAKARELRSLMRTRARYYDVSSPTVAVTAR
jgi:cell division protein FtsQ